MVIPNANRPAQPARTAACDTTAAYRQRKIALAQIPARSLARIHVNVAIAAEATLIAIPKLEAHKAEIKHLYNTTADLVHELEISALAAWHADALGIKGPQDDLQAIANEGYAIRADLLQWASVLSRRGIIDSTKVDTIEMKRGYRELAVDLVRLVDAFEESWDSIDGKILVTKGEIEHARALSGRILDRIVGRRSDRTDSDPGPMQMRQRAFTRLVQDHRRVARAIAFIVGPDGDPNEILPPLSPAYLYGAARRAPAAKIAPETGPIDVEGSVDSASKVAATPTGDTTGESTPQPAAPMDADTPTPMSEPAAPTASPATPVGEPTPPTEDVTESPPCATHPRSDSNGARACRPRAALKMKLARPCAPRARGRVNAPIPGPTAPRPDACRRRQALHDRRQPGSVSVPQIDANTAASRFYSIRHGAARPALHSWTAHAVICSPKLELLDRLHSPL